MEIGLVDVDSHAKKKKWGATICPNLALCKISAYHKAKGDNVVWYDPMFTGYCDKVYISKIFNFTPDIDFPIDADEVIRGGQDTMSHLSCQRRLTEYSLTTPYILLFLMTLRTAS